MKERYQQELAKRAHYTLPFMDGSTVSGIVRKIMDDMERIGPRSGTITFPEPLTPKEEGKVRRILGRHHGGLVRRIETFAPVRLAEGIGTEVLIREKGNMR